MLIRDEIENILTNESFNELETKFNAPDRKQFSNGLEVPKYCLPQQLVITD